MNMLCNSLKLRGTNYHFKRVKRPEKPASAGIDKQISTDQQLKHCSLCLSWLLQQWGIRCSFYNFPM